MAKPVEQWRGLTDFAKVLGEMSAALECKVPEDIAVTMANLQGLMDWFQVENKIELNAQRIEAEFSHYEETYDDEVTVRQWPPADVERLDDSTILWGGGGRKAEGQYGSG